MLPNTGMAEPAEGGGHASEARCPTLPNTAHRGAGRLSWLEQAQAGRLSEGFLAAVGVQFAVEAADLRPDCEGRDHQFGGHLGVSLPDTFKMKELAKGKW